MDKITFVNKGQPAINDTNLNLLQDNIENAIEIGYSTNEINTNQKWIDGKPIYRKVVQYYNNETIGKAGETVQITIPHLISNLDIVVHSYTSTNGTTSIPLISSTSNTSVSKISKSDITLQIENDTWGPRYWYFVIEYTKTTDGIATLMVD